MRRKRRHIRSLKNAVTKQRTVTYDSSQCGIIVLCATEAAKHHIVFVLSVREHVCVRVSLPPVTK